MKRCETRAALAALLLILCLLLSLPAAAEDGGGYVSLTSDWANSGFVYSDEMLMADARALSPDLAKVSVVLASAAYKKSAVNALLDGMGFTQRSDYDSYATIADMGVPDYDKVAFTIATKEYNGFLLYCVPVKGTGANTEWLSDFNLGDPAENDGYHAGFYTAAKPILSLLRGLFAADGHTPATRVVWLTGHSRGAAVANLVAGQLQSEDKYVSAAHVFGYNFACPSVGQGKSGCNNIFNFNNAGDLIPLLPLQDAWGYSRYGIDIKQDLHERSSVTERFYRQNKGAYAGYGSDEKWMEALLSVCASQDDYRLVRPCLDVVSYKMLGANKNVTPEQFRAYLRKEYAGLVSADTAITLGELILNIAEGNFYTAIDRYTGMLTDLIDHMMLPEEEQDPDYIQKLLPDINSAVNTLLGYEISTLESANRGVQAIKALRGYSSAIEPVYRAVLNLFTNNGDPETAIWDAHDWKTYEIWISSLYCGYRAFAGFDNPRLLAEADLTKGTVIGPYAFAECAGLSVLNIPDNIRAVGTYAFDRCTALQSVTLPNSVVWLGSGAFSGCTGVTSVTLPVELNYRGFDCPNTQTIHYTVSGDGRMPDRQIGFSSEANYVGTTLEYAARYALTTAIFDEGVTHIGSLAFYNPDFTSEYHSELGRYVKTYAGFPQLTSVALPQTLTSVGSSAFRYDAALTDIDLPAALESLGTACFADSGIDHLAIPETLAEIPEKCFSGCAKLTALEIPDTVASIGEQAFYGCVGVTGITLPAELSRFRIFECPAAQSITYTARDTGVMPDRGTNSYGGEGLLRETLEYSCFGSLTAVTFREGVTSIGDNAFRGAEKLKTAVPCDTLTRIGRYAFYGARALTEFDLPASLEKLSEASFMQSGLTGFALPPLITAVPDSCFRGCKGLTELTIPNTVTTLNAYAFADCENVADVTLPVELPTNHAFGCPNIKTIHYTVADTGWMPDRGDGSSHNGNNYNYWMEYGARNSLTKVVFDEGVTRIGAYAFYSDETADGEYTGYPCLTSVTLPDTVEVIGSCAFMYDAGLQGVRFPRALRTMFNECFAQTGLRSGVFTGPLPDIREGVFDGLEATMYYFSKQKGWADADLESYGEGLSWVALDGDAENAFTVPAALRVIGEEAFAGTAFGAVTLSEGVTGIGPRAFADCPGLALARLPASLTEIAEDAFGESTLLLVPPDSYAEEYARGCGAPYITLE